MEIVFLGTGNAFTRQYYNSNLLIEFSQTNLLIDCGTTCPASIESLGIDIKRIDNVFISHLHADHVGGLEELAIKHRYIYQKKPNLYVPARLQNDIWQHTLRGGLEFTVDGRVGIEYYFELHVVKDSFSIENKTFEIIPTLHIPGMPSYGIFFDGIFFTNDTVFQRALIERMLEKSKIIIHDCSFVHNPVHAYYKELLELPKAIREKFFLIHYGDGTKEKQKYMADQGFHIAQKHERLSFDKKNSEIGNRLQNILL